MCTYQRVSGKKRRNIYTRLNIYIPSIKRTPFDEEKMMISHMNDSINDTI